MTPAEREAFRAALVCLSDAFDRLYEIHAGHGEERTEIERLNRLFHARPRQERHRRPQRGVS